MPMPTGGAWPPPHLAQAYNAYRDWDAWYVGNPDQLANVYQGRDTSPNRRTRPGQYAGGVIGTISRWLWGAPVPTTTRDSRLHVPLPADLASTAAALLFSEPPALTHENTLLQDRLEQLVEAGLNSALRHAAEANSALGDVYLRPVIDREVSPDAAIFTTVHADGAIPVIRWGHLVEVTFWSELASDQTGIVMRLLEHHEVGRITYSLFKGSANNLGQAVSLADHPDAEPLAKLVDEASGQATGLDRLDVVRIPNAGPQRRWRKLGGGLKYLGRSDFDGNEQIFDKIDSVWTSWMRDIHLGRGRLTVPAYMLDNLGAGLGASWDADREVYSAVNAMPNQPGGVGITVSQFQIRHQEHKATLDALVETAMRHAGLSSQTLGEEGDVAMTATEAQSRERMSYITRGDRIATWGPGIADYVELHLMVERINGLSTLDPVLPNVEWGDSVSESPEATARTMQMLRAAEIISIETGVKMLHPDWDETEIKAEIQRIKDDYGIGPVQDPATFTGAPPPNQPPGVPPTQDPGAPPQQGDPTAGG